MSKITCLLLAAGLSRRMGEVNKLLLPVHGKSLVRRTAEELLKFPFQEIFVVTGHDNEAITLQLESLPVIKIVHNSNYEAGMHSSIRAGLLHGAAARPQGFMICLADQPSFNVHVIEKLAKVFFEGAAEGKTQIVFPTFNGKKGHPVFISAHFVNEILSEHDGDHGCNYLFQRHPENLVAVQVNDESILVDIDTPEQYQDLGRHL